MLLSEHLFKIDCSDDFGTHFLSEQILSVFCWWLHCLSATLYALRQWHVHWQVYYLSSIICYIQRHFSEVCSRFFPNTPRKSSQSSQCLFAFVRQVAKSKMAVCWKPYSCISGNIFRAACVSICGKYHPKPTLFDVAPYHVYNKYPKNCTKSNKSAFGKKT